VIQDADNINNLANGFRASAHRHDCAVMAARPASAESAARRHDDAVGYRSVVGKKRVSPEGPGQRGACTLAGCR